MTNKNKGHIGPPSTATTPPHVQDVRAHLEQSPRKSTRQLSQEVGISRTSVRRIIHGDLKLFPYKVQFLQAPLSVEKTTVWCAIGKNGIFGPYFFEDSDGRRVTANSERYIDMLRRRFIPAIRRKRAVDMNTVVFQQDGAPPHCSNRTLEYLRQYFPGDRLISRRTDNPWPPYSPDLTPPDYFLWGYLKARVYQDNPPTIERLKENIKREIRIPRYMLERVIENFNVNQP